MSDTYSNDQYEEIAKEIATVAIDHGVHNLQAKIAKLYHTLAEEREEQGAKSIHLNPDKIEELADGIYDAMSEHLHKDILGISDKGYDELKGWERSDGTSFMEGFTQRRYKISRGDLKKILQKSKDGLHLNGQNPMVQYHINENEKYTIPKPLHDSLKKAYEEHISKLEDVVIAERQLHHPKHMKSMRDATEYLADKHNKQKLDKEELQTIPAIQEGFKIMAKAIFKPQDKGKIVTWDEIQGKQLVETDRAIRGVSAFLEQKEEQIKERIRDLEQDIEDLQNKLPTIQDPERIQEIQDTIAKLSKQKADLEQDKSDIEQLTGQ